MYKTKNNRIFIFISIVFLFTIINGLFFQTSHFDHDCTGDECPVCAVIQAISDSVLSSDFFEITKGADFEFCTLASRTFYHIEFLIFDTPVKKKIRLLF